MGRKFTGFAPSWSPVLAYSWVSDPTLGNHATHLLCRSRKSCHPRLLPELKEKSKSPESFPTPTTRRVPFSHATHTPRLISLRHLSMHSSEATSSAPRSHRTRVDAAHEEGRRRINTPRFRPNDSPSPRKNVLANPHPQWSALSLRGRRPRWCPRLQHRRRLVQTLEAI